MHEFLVNLIIGIMGGVYSSIIVTRVFLVRSELEDQIDILRTLTYRFGSLSAFFNAIEIILKLSSDTSSDIEREIKRDPNYLNTHDIIHAQDAISSIKVSLLDKTIDEICNQDISIKLKNKEYKKLHNETVKIFSEYKNIKEFKFKTIDDCIKEIQELEDKYVQCIDKRRKEFIKFLVRDKTLIALLIVFVVLCIFLAIV